MMIPTLKTHCAPKRGLTEAVVHRLVNGLDKRRNIDPEAARGVLCGILAMRGVDEFVVNRAELTKEECKAFDAITEAHFGELLNRRSGRNVYGARDSFRQQMVVYDTLPRDFKFKVSGDGVEFQNSEAITSPDLVKNISLYRAVTLKMTDVANSFHYVIMGEALPARFHTLGDGEVLPCEMAEDLAHTFRDNIKFWLSKSGHLSVFINQDRDPNVFWFSCADIAVSSFQRNLNRWMREWYRSVGLPSIIFPIQATRFDGAMVEFLGEPEEQNLHALAGH